MSDKSRARPMPPPREEAPEGETSREKWQRNRRNKEAAQRWLAFRSEVCAFCGLTRGNVIHEEDPANAPEGPEYFADMAMHYFVAPSR